MNFLSNIFRILLFINLAASICTEFEFVGRIRPPGRYQIVLSDFEAKCKNEGEYLVEKEEKMKLEGKNEEKKMVKLLRKIAFLGKGEMGAKCFEHFYTAKTDEEGRFRVGHEMVKTKGWFGWKLENPKIPTNILCINILPLNGEWGFLPSGDDPKEVAVQTQIIVKNEENEQFIRRHNVQKGDGEINYMEADRIIGYHLERGKVLDGMVKRWMNGEWRDRAQREEDAFFLAAYFRELMDSASDQNLIVHADALLLGQIGKKLAENLDLPKRAKWFAKIRRMPGMLELIDRFCTIKNPQFLKRTKEIGRENWVAICNFQLEKINKKMEN